MTYRLSGKETCPYCSSAVDETGLIPTQEYVCPACHQEMIYDGPAEEEETA